MVSFFKQHLPFLHHADSFFVVEVLGELLRGSLLAVSSENKQVSIIRTVSFPLPGHSAEVFASVLTQVKRSFRLPVSVRTIVLLDYRRAAVVSGSVSLMRSDPKSDIKQAELENLVSQGLWKLAAPQRELAAEKMGIEEARIRLADADVVKVKLNNHRVVNPIGFSAKTIEISYRETFVDQAILHVLHAELTDDNLATIIEGSAVLAGFIARLNPVNRLLFVDVGAQESIVYRVDQMMLSYVDSFAWGSKTLISSMAKEFSLDERGAVAMIERYASNEVSPVMRRAIERAASGELAILSNGLAAHQPEGAQLPVFVHAGIPLPSVVFDPTFARRLGLSLTLTAVNEQFIGAHTGFVVQLGQQRSGSGGEYSFGTALAAVADVYATATMPLMTKTAKQRARWAQSG